MGALHNDLFKARFLELFGQKTQVEDHALSRRCLILFYA
jgi:hypothetical protein